MTCPDTVTYDWATITLHNNSTGTTATVLGRVCTTNAAWTNVTAGVSAGTSYTLTLTSHDDNYAADPTFTLFDDAALN
jgi:serine protease